MYDEIYHMVSENIKTAGIIIQTKAEISNRSWQPLRRCDVERFLYIRPEKALEMYIYIFDDIRNIIELPFAVETVSIDNNQKYKKRDEGKCVIS